MPKTRRSRRGNEVCLHVGAGKGTSPVVKKKKGSGKNLLAGQGKFTCKRIGEGIWDSTGIQPLGVGSWRKKEPREYGRGKSGLSPHGLLGVLQSEETRRKKGR